MGIFDRLFKAGTDVQNNPQNRNPILDSKATGLLETGMLLEQQGLLDEALQHYVSAAKLQPSLARAHFNQGIIFLDRGDTAKAMAAFSKAIHYKPDSAATHYNIGKSQFLLGNHQSAINAYEQAIILKPDFSDAFVALGCALEDMGRNYEAVSYYRQALGIQPSAVEVQLALANLLKAIGCLDEAVVEYRKILVLQPDFAEVRGNLGNVLHELGLFSDAAESYRRVLVLRPNDAIAHNNLGNALRELGCAAESLASYRKAVETDPGFSVAHFNIGLAMQRMRHNKQALKSYKTAVDINPEYVEAHLNMGFLLRDFAQLEQAESCCRKALASRPNCAEAHLCLGNIHQDRGHYDNAIASYLHALALRQNYTDAYINLGAALTMIGHLNDAVENYKRALEIQPNNAETQNNLGTAFLNLGRLEEGMACCYRALDLKPDYTAAFSNLLFQHNYLEDQSTSSMLVEARKFGDLVAAMARPRTKWNVTSDSSRSLRVGLVSGDLRQHPVGYFIEGVLKELAFLASDRLKIFAYSSRDVNDPTSKRIQTYCHQWRLIAGMSDQELAEIIASECIDVLIDLSGHTAHNRLPVFAWKPAPVQVSWLGYFATTGVAAIDYFLADPWTAPLTLESQFSEKIWRLPETRLCFTAPETDVPVSSLPALQNGYVTFGCFNNLNKINATVVALWARILIAIPRSRLLLKCAQFQDGSIREEILRKFSAHGVHPTRLTLEQFVPRANYLLAYQRVDIGLDPFPFPGGTTTAESLWMGVPVLTLAGSSFLSLQGVGLMMNAGLKEWVATDQENYLERAIVLASKLQELAALRSELRRQVTTSPVFDSTRFAKHFEDALRGMWQQWCADSSNRLHPTPKDINNGAI